MRAQIGIHLAGAAGEGIHRGVLRWDEVQEFAATDLKKAAMVGDDWRRLTGVRYSEQVFFAGVHVLVKANWPAVEALASALVETGGSKATASKQSLITA